MDKIGFIGLGNMGGKIAKAICSHGYPLMVYDIDLSAANAFEGGAAIAESEEEVFRNSDITILSLPSSAIVETVLECFLRAGVGGKIIFDTSTSFPLSTRKYFEIIKAGGGHLADGPISGMPHQADEGKLMCMFGGEPEIYEKLKPVVSCFADRYPNMGGSGNGHVTKLIFNYIAMSYVNLYAMSFSLTEHMGLDNDLLLEMLQTTAMGCGILNFYAPKMINKTYDMAFALELAHKDLTYVKSIFESYQVPAFALDCVLNMLRTSIRDGKGKLDYSTCIATMHEYFEGKHK